MPRSACLLLLAAGAALAQPSPRTVTSTPVTPRVIVEATNPLGSAREDEVLSLDWGALRRRLPSLSASAVRVVEAASGREAPSQVLDLDVDGTPEALLVLAPFWPNETRRFAIEARAPDSAYAARVHARHDAERDDLAWESDRIAFRTYGKGLWRLEQDVISSGIDVWPKRTRALILERWYAAGHDAYHRDTGEGADFFSVGQTLGGGGTALWDGQRLVRAHNFAAYRILADGPIRTVFELTYEPVEAGGVRVQETKRFTMDAGQHLFRQESTFRAEGADSVTYAIGLVKRADVTGSFNSAGPWAWVSLWGPVAVSTGGNVGGHGDLGTAVMLERPRMRGLVDENRHVLALGRARSGVPVVHYVGAGWTASRDFADVADWWAFLNRQAQRLGAPIRVTLVNETARAGG
ncbi:MAG TPA: DUF4861 domain-containing protein [Rhodothermales bacterium]|nr:DUF4861 domain-containing protein [Rhodothermales bacterium]